ncbi:BQ5605_C003g02082 [Microbotryum silenes-dioicae]|uniref:BQ5605_C003g02082 protein n=1 Tax=Microbotryum silenes-dioicae TaxID=796604 RepID=A0A2X0M4Y6_9BASI|nr:BQ5605_C003g02082 [Microbotryum silenes-dioicae]
MTSAAVARSIYKQCTRKQKRSCHRLIRRAALLSLCQFTDPPAHPITFNQIPTQLNTTTKLNAMATFKMQDSTGAAATQAGLSEERSNRLIVTGLPATSATSANETLTKHLLHLLEISGVPPSRQHKYTISLAQASLGNIDGHPAKSATPPKRWRTNLRWT